MMFKKIITAMAMALTLSTPILAQERTFVTNPPTTSGSGVTYNSGTDTVTATAADGARLYTATRPIEEGAKYKYEFTVSGYSAGSVAPYVGTTRDTSTPPTLNATVTAAADPFNPGLAPIADNFTTANGLEAGEISALNSSADPVGAFRFHCVSGQIQSADPLVVYGKPGASHMHNFFGNTGANAFSTYKSLRASGGSTCGSDQANPINRSAYWFPAMLNGRGGVITTAGVNVYYKRAPLGQVDCEGYTTGTGICTRLPHGLNMIWGYNMSTMAANTDTFSWHCRARQDAGAADMGPSVGGVFFTSLQALRDAGTCPIGAVITVSTASPTCWDGTRLDTPNHRDHVAHGSRLNGGGALFHGKCSATHPYHFTEITLQIDWDVDANLDTWRLSSDDQMGMGVAAGSTFHTDYMMAWSPSYLDSWEDNCIDGKRSCSGQTNGIGSAVKGGNNTSTKSRVVPLVRQGLGRKRSKNGLFKGEFTAPADGEFGLNFYLFTGNITGFKVTKISKGASGPVTQTVTQ